MVELAWLLGIKSSDPFDLGGLGILNLEFMSWVLQIRWLWFKKTDPNQAWAGLDDIHIHPNVVALFNIALESKVSNGRNTLFWEDKWLMGYYLEDLAPAVVAVVPSRTRKQRTVADALQGHAWPADISGGLSLVGLFEYFQLWDILHKAILSQDDDVHVWRLEGSRQFTSKSAYQAFFNGSITFAPWRRLRKSWAPAKCKLFLWLAIRRPIGQKRITSPNPLPLV
jgi:hypothetical protein